MFRPIRRNRAQPFSLIRTAARSSIRGWRSRHLRCDLYGRRRVRHEPVRRHDHQYFIVRYRNKPKRFLRRGRHGQQRGRHQRRSRTCRNVRVLDLFGPCHRSDHRRIHRRRGRGRCQQHVRTRGRPWPDHAERVRIVRHQFRHAEIRSGCQLGRRRQQQYRRNHHRRLRPQRHDQRRRG